VPFIITKQFNRHIFMFFSAKVKRYVRNFKRFAFFKDTKDTKKKFIPQFLFPKDICVQDTKTKTRQQQSVDYKRGSFLQMLFTILVPSFSSSVLLLYIKLFSPSLHLGQAAMFDNNIKLYKIKPEQPNLFLSCLI